MHQRNSNMHAHPKLALASPMGMMHAPPPVHTFAEHARLLSCGVYRRWGYKGCNGRRHF